MPDYLFVTGKLAADALMTTLQRITPALDYDVAVLNITVASLMDTQWIARHLAEAPGCRQVIIPGLCQGDPSIIQERVSNPVFKGPKDLKDLPGFFGCEQDRKNYGEYQVKILAEIVDAYRMSWKDILAKAVYYRDSGADIIDLGCPPQGGFPGVEKVVAGLKKRGFIVSLDTFDPQTILHADKAGLDLLLSINSKNIDLAPKLRCKMVVIPDFGEGLTSLERNAAQLEKWGVSYVMDPVLDPISFGFTESLHRFYQVRHRHPDAEMLMGIGNVTELTDADSTGINALMAGVITELKINYVLTTEVISWAKGAVRELDLARKLMYYAHKNRILPKNIDDSLIIVKDLPYETYTEAELRHMQTQVKDRHFRIFTDDKNIYVFNNRLFVKGTDTEAIFAELSVNDSTHAFYLGRELQKASLAIRLGKRYTQEQDLHWGYLGQHKS